MAYYREFPDTTAGQIERRSFWCSEEGCALIGQWLREGETVENVCVRYVGVSEPTIAKWRKRPEGELLDRTMRRTAEACDAMVEESLLKRALGYDVEEEDWELVEGEMRRVRVHRRHVPPDTKAALSWLYSRRSERWRAQQEPLDRSREARDRVQEVVVKVVAAAEEAAPGIKDETTSLTSAITTDGSDR